MKYTSILTALLLGLGTVGCNQENQPEPTTPASESEQAPTPGLDTNSGEPTPANTDPAGNTDPAAGSGGTAAMGAPSPGSTGTP